MLTLPIEIDKKYLTRDGQVVAVKQGCNPGLVKTDNGIYVWKGTGLTSTRGVTHPEDLVSDYTEVKSHPHAESMRLYAEDATKTDKPWKLWEYKSSQDTLWTGGQTQLRWHESVQYRRKSHTILINGIEVPEPLRVAPAGGTEVWIPSLSGKDKCHALTWRYDGNWWGLELERGLVHMTRGAAVAHAEALLSFTKD